MKKRILSFVLAVVMVLAMVPVAAIGASAEGGMGIEFSLSNYTVTPGGTAYVDLYASVEDMLGYDGICNFQVYFTLPEGVSICQDGHTYYNVGVKPVAGTVNVGDAMICGSAYGDLGEYIATAEQLTAKGGALLATVAFSVPAAAEGTVYDITVANVSDFNLRKTEGETQNDVKTSEADLAAAVKGTGKVTVQTVEDVVAEGYEGAGESYTIPYGTDSLTKDGKLTGSFDTLIIPATVSSASKNALQGATFAGVALKNTQYTTLLAGVSALVEGGKVDTIYYHKRANGVDTTKDTVISAIAALEEENEEEYDVAVKNILSAGAVVDGQTVTFYGNIVVDDVQYEDVCVEAKFTYTNGGDTVTKTFTSKATKYVYTTLTNDGAPVVSTNEEFANAAGAFVDGSYLFGAVVNGVPAGATFEVTAYGRTKDANGNLIYVCSDAYAGTVGA